VKRVLYGLVLLLASLQVSSQSSIVETVHNLSTSGPGPYKSETIDQVCAFCHTPHRAAPGRGLWNRGVAGPSEELYRSSTTAVQEAELSGSSLLCQSCHDGTIALGQMRVPPRRGSAGERKLLSVALTGRSRIGTSLANHHPIGFDYEDVYRDTETGLSRVHRIDLPLEGGKMQCTTCHDAHSSTHQPFLRKRSNWGELCLECHRLSGKNWAWAESGHAVSNREPLVGNNPWPERKPEWAGKAVSENSCQNCHASHHANPPERLMVDKEEKLCFRCHDGSVAESDIRREFTKFSTHPVDRDSTGQHDAVRRELRSRLQMHAECEDCHNPHASIASLPMISFRLSNLSISETSEAPDANGAIAGVPGIDILGQPKEEIDYQYELCFRCHGEPGKSACGNRRCSTADRYDMVRQDNLYNLREKVDPSNPELVSWHPIVENNQANNFEVPSLRAFRGVNAFNSLIYCTDCHNSESAAAFGGDGPNGPHGSRHEGLLAQGYQLNPNARFNQGFDRLCFACHDDNNLFSDESFPHRLHVLQQGNLCVSCHDPHGSAKYPHLINFLTRTQVGQDFTITGAGGFPEPTWLDAGSFAGTCYLSCHGAVHDGTQYGIELAPPARR
jgi:predicted CXXCH cytochrome family protein